VKREKSSAVFIFIGALLVVIFAVGLVSERNPEAFLTRYRSELALEHFLAFCRIVWLPAGIIGFPMLLISLILSLIREKKNR